MPRIPYRCPVCWVNEVQYPGDEPCSDCRLRQRESEFDSMLTEHMLRESRRTDDSPSSPALSSVYDGTESRAYGYSRNSNLSLANGNGSSSHDGDRSTNGSRSRGANRNGYQNGETESRQLSGRESSEGQAGRVVLRYGARNGIRLREEQGQQDVFDSEDEREILTARQARSRDYRRAIAARTSEGYERDWVTDRAREDIGALSGDSVVVSEEEEYQRNRRRRNGR